MKIYNDIEQGSADWRSMRLGKITASKIKDVITNGRGGKPSKTAESYMFELLSEMLTGEAKPFFENDAMRWGTETEPQARAMYELMTGNDVEEVAFMELDAFIGMSPDGLIGEDGLIEIKCPNTTTQLKRALSDCYHEDYKAQIQMQLWVSNRKWCDFVSFDPRLEIDSQILIERVERDEDFISNMKEKVELFVTELKAKLNTLTEK